jgi:internalin A
VAKTLAELVSQARSTKRFRVDGREEDSSQFTDLDFLPLSLRQVSDLRILQVAHCSLFTVPDWIIEFTSLEELVIYDNPLTDFPIKITEMTSLRRLIINDAKLAAVPPEIGRLSQLEALGLANNNIDELPVEICNLKDLKALDLGANRLGSLPSLDSLSRLTHLYLWKNNFSEIPSQLRALKKLEVLELSTNGQSNLASDHYQESPPDALISYRTTGIGSGPEAATSGFDSIPNWLADDLPSLRKLYLGGHQIHRIPENFPAGLTKLRGVYLANNRFDAMPSALLRMPWLEELDLRDNNIEQIPDGLRNLSALRYLDLEGNPLRIPPEVLARSGDPAGIVEYSTGADQDKRSLDEAKLIIVGEGSVGKTSLINRIVHNRYFDDEQRTEGIDVTRWTLDVDGVGTSLNIWDFGGQEIMHATHQFFLTKRSIYILVIDVRQGEEQNRIEYWLKLIQSFSDHSPVIIVGNKTDQGVLDIDQRGLRSKYPDIVDITSVSCESGKGIEAIRTLLSANLKRLSHVRDLLPIAFFDIKGYLENLSANYLPYSDYLQLCRERGIDSRATQERLIEFLHDLGTVLCFRADPRLKDFNILNPSWVTGGVYRLLNSNLAAQRKGLLRWADIDTILDDDEYPAERRPFIIEMMKKFELCYESDDVFLIPDLLTKEEPDTGSWDDSLNFEIKYDILPSSIISRLIVRMNALISRGTVWRTGMVLKLDKNRALVKSDREEGVISINVSGAQNGRRGLLTAIRTELRKIEKTIPGIGSEERVPIPENAAVWVPYNHLLDLENAGQQTVIPYGLTRQFNVRSLLAGIEDPSDRIAGSKNVEGGNASSSRRPAQKSTPSPQPMRDSMVIGTFLAIFLLIILVAFGATYKLLGSVAAITISTALIATIILAIIILRVAGKITERGFLQLMKTILSWLSRKEQD